MHEGVVINILLAVIGFLMGVGTAHIFILKKVNGHDVIIGQHETRISNGERVAGIAHEDHQATLRLLTKMADQNNLLIQKITVERT